MNYRKFKADQLFTGFELLGSDKVLITTPDGEVISILDEAEAGNDVEVFEGILTPGFINAHCHLELSHLKGVIPERTGLVDFVFNVINERQFRDEVIYDAITTAEKEMWMNGIVAVGDICNNALSLPQKLRGNLAFYNFVESSGWLPGISQLRWQKSKELFDLFSEHFSKTAIVPHAPYSVSSELWEYLSPFFEGSIVSIHNQETIFEDELFLTGTGDLTRMYKMMNIDNSFFIPRNCTSVQSYFHRLSNAATVIFVHNTFTSQGDINFVNENKPAQQLISYCLCPRANIYIENKLPPVELLMANKCFIILGTDSLASNHSLHILEEMRTIQRSFPTVPLPELLTWATSNGARALNLDGVLGSFEKGKKPGVVLVEEVDREALTSRSSSKRIL